MNPWRVPPPTFGWSCRSTTWEDWKTSTTCDVPGCQQMHFFVARLPAWELRRGKKTLVIPLTPRGSSPYLAALRTGVN